MSLEQFLSEYIETKGNNYPEILKIYTQHEKVPDECYLLLEEEEGQRIEVGGCTKKPIQQTCDIGLILKFENRTEEETKTLIDEIGTRFLTELEKDLTLAGKIITGKIEKQSKHRFNDYGMKARCNQWQYTGTYWS